MSVGGFGKNVVIFGFDMRSSVHVDNKKTDILILGEGPTQALDDTTEKKYSINFSEHGKKLCLSLHCNVANSYLFVNGVELHKFKAKDSKINAGLLCLGNVSKDASVDNIKRLDFMDMLMILA